MIHSDAYKSCNQRRMDCEKCIGSKVVTQIGGVLHCHRHCEKWLAVGPDTKAQILIDEGGYLQCTASWYPTGSTKCKVEEKKFCIGGCTNMHNQELHFAKDQRVHQVNTVEEAPVSGEDVLLMV